MDEKVMELTRSEEVKGMMPASDGINVVRWFAVESERNRRESIRRHKEELVRAFRIRQHIKSGMILAGFLLVLGGAGTAEIGDLRVGVITMLVGFAVGILGVVWEVFA